MLTDLYVLAAERSSLFIERFLARFLPDRETSSVEYEIPQYSDLPDLIFSQADDLILYCIAHPQCTQVVYWRNRNIDGELQSPHVFFLGDGGMILGLSTSLENTDEQSQILAEMREIARSHCSLITTEQPPPNSRSEFLRAGVSTR
jgi:hypothetical protein